MNWGHVIGDAIVGAMAGVGFGAALVQRKINRELFASILDIVIKAANDGDPTLLRSVLERHSKGGTHAGTKARAAKRNATPE